MFTVGDLVRAERAKRRMTQTDLATRAGLHLNTVSFIETGRTMTPSLKTLNRIAAALGCSLHQLVPPEPLAA
jgi:transcriptional regulator with XRE-family HTH domain